MPGETVSQNVFIQFFGPVHIPKIQYREYRVRLSTIAVGRDNGPTPETYLEDVQNIIELHKKEISDLKDKMRERMSGKDMKTASDRLNRFIRTNIYWTSNKTLTGGFPRNLLTRLLAAGPELIRQFELENFWCDHEWTRIKTASNPAAFRNILSIRERVTADGRPISRFEQIDARNARVTPPRNAVRGSESTIALEPVAQVDGVDTKTSKPTEDDGQRDHAKNVIGDDLRKKETNANSKDQTTKQSGGKEDEPGGNGSTGQTQEGEQEDGSRPIVSETSTDGEVSSGTDSGVSSSPVSMNEELCEELMRSHNDNAIVEYVVLNPRVEKRKKEVLIGLVRELNAAVKSRNRRDRDALEKTRNRLRRLIDLKFNAKSIKEQEEGDEPQQCCSSSGTRDEKTAEQTESGVDEEERDSDNSEQQNTSAGVNSDNHQQTSNGIRASNNHRKKKGKKGKKAKKCNKGPKVTQEEIEAIKKQKKAEADKEFERIEGERRAHMNQVELMHRQKCYRQLVHTALEMRAQGDPLPVEVQEVEGFMDYYVNSVKFEHKITLRNLFFEQRVNEIQRDYYGSELSSKMHVVTDYYKIVARGLRVCQYLMFLAVLDERSYGYSDFEALLLQYFFIGTEENPETSKSEVYRRFCFFVEVALKNISEEEQIVNAIHYVRDKLWLFDELMAHYDVTRVEMILREGYLGIAQHMLNHLSTTDTISYIQSCRGKSSYNMSEAWLLQTRMPGEYTVHI
ncbi:unnamed protein product [Caenorhabditis nigoni]